MNNINSIQALQTPNIQSLTEKKYIQSGPKIGFDKLIIVGNTSTNALLNTSFNKTFETNDSTEFLKLVNKQLPELYSKGAKQPISTSLKTNYLMYGLPLSGRIGDNETQVTLDKTGRLQITNSSIGNLMVDQGDLNNGEWKQTFWERNVYSYVPGLKDIPVPKFIPTPGSTKVSNKEVISGGVRFLDPWPQSEWVNTSLGKNWPPDPHTTKGPIKLSLDRNQQALLMDTNHPSSLNVGKTYGVIPRGIVSINPDDSSIILAIQQTNINKNPSINLAPWIIAPVKVPKGKRSLAAVPIQNDIRQHPASSGNNIPNWLKVIENNQKWKLDKSNEFLIIDPQAQGEQSKVNTNNTNWALYAIEGSDKVIIMRSMYQHPDQFQAFVRKSDKTQQAEYIELEYTGPKVPPGYSSTVAIKWDFLPVSLLCNGQFTKFGETNNLENEVLTVSKSLSNLIGKVNQN